MTMEMTVSEARSRLGDVLDQARLQRQPVFLTRRGKRVGVIASIEQWPGPVEQVATNEQVAQQIAQLRELAASMIAPGIEPLLNPSEFYETRQPRL